MDPIRPCTHFVNFRDRMRFANACKVFGPPDFVHYQWDMRAQREIADCDTVVFAKGTDADTPSRYSFDDSAIF